MKIAIELKLQGWGGTLGGWGWGGKLGVGVKGNLEGSLAKEKIFNEAKRKLPSNMEQFCGASGAS